jgi:hypothetical protein
MKPMTPLFEGSVESEQILPSNQSNHQETTDYVPINLDLHLASTTNNEEIFHPKGRNKLVSDFNTVNKQKN